MLVEVNHQLWLDRLEIMRENPLVRLECSRRQAFLRREKSLNLCCAFATAIGESLHVKVLPLAMLLGEDAP